MRSNPARNPFFIKIFTYRRGGRLSLHVQTVSTSRMSKLVNTSKESENPSKVPFIFKLMRIRDATFLLIVLSGVCCLVSPLDWGYA